MSEDRSPLWIRVWGWFTLALVAWSLAGCCGARDAVATATQPQQDPSTLAGLGEWAIWLGGAGLLLSAVGAVLAPPGLRARVASVAMAAGALIAGGWLLGVIDRWLALVMTTALVGAVLCAVAWLWGRRRKIMLAAEEWTGVDLPGDWDQVDTEPVERRSNA
jgi:hypothetical protein